ncbi:putative 1-acylglycerol-3-phosphate acyltransferase [Myxozyma melibiosi]|uniref:1-acyl-sn-glycerol-3-phosphate acyltransferase n=1 Tax=Myxozyma melibiosi TaxID=54550 RepID=A0ABR1EYA1_9ASCO
MSAFLSAITVVIAVTLSLNMLGSVIHPLRFWTRVLVFLVSMSFCASYGVVTSIILSLLGKRSLCQWVAGRAFSTITAPLLGLKFEIENEALLRDTRPAIVVANHQTELDVLILGRLFPRHCSVTAKSTLKYVPFLGWFMLFSGTVFIDRTNRGKAIKALDGAIADMQKAKQSVFIFPEGTRSYSTTPELLPFKRGAFHLAMQSGFPIIPVVVANYSHLYSPKNRTFESGTLKIKVLDKIDMEGRSAEEIDELVASTRTKMLETLKEISNKPATPDADSETTQLLSSDSTVVEEAETISASPKSVGAQ